MPDAKRRIVRGGDGAQIVFGDRSPAAVKRLGRMADEGLVKSVRVGPRSDRWYSTAELERLLDSIESGEPVERTDEAS